MYFCVVTAVEYVPSITSSTHSNINGRVACSMYIYICVCLEKNPNASRPSEHPPVREKVVKTFRRDHRLFVSSLISLITDGSHDYHPAWGHYDASTVRTEI